MLFINYWLCIKGGDVFMKEATGELSMTVVVIVAVIAIMAILTAFLMPSMKNYIGKAWGSIDKGTSEAENVNGIHG